MLDTVKSSDLQSLLLIGLDLTALAKSTRTAGFKVYAADYFGDYDLVKFCDGYRSVIKQEAGKSCGRIESGFNPEKLASLAKAILEEEHIDAILLSSGLDDSFEVLEELEELVPILGNKPEIFRRVRDKSNFFGELKRLNLPYPETAVVDDLEAARRAAKDIGYPVIVKPSMGFAGLAVRKAEDADELWRFFKLASSIDSEVVVQKYIDGVHASISFVSSEREVRILTVNEQLLGLREVGQQESFGFCGNIVPFGIDSETFQKCEFMVEKIASHFDFRGSNGIDFVLSSEGTPYIIEVNPRFQATLECVEQVLNLNLVKIHVKACLGEPLPTLSRRIDKYCTRLILFSKGRIKVGNLTNLSWVRDIPFPGVIIEKGEPLCSVLAKADSKNLSFKKALERANLVYEKFTVQV